MLHASHEPSVGYSRHFTSQRCARLYEFPGHTQHRGGPRVISSNIIEYIMIKKTGSQVYFQIKVHHFEDLCTLCGNILS